MRYASLGKSAQVADDKKSRNSDVILFKLSKALSTAKALFRNQKDCQKQEERDGGLCEDFFICRYLKI